jgi:hypothetical protein
MYKSDDPVVGLNKVFKNFGEAMDNGKLKSEKFVLHIVKGLETNESQKMILDGIDGNGKIKMLKGGGNTNLEKFIKRLWKLIIDLEKLVNKLNSDLKKVQNLKGGNGSDQLAVPGKGKRWDDKSNVVIAWVCFQTFVYWGIVVGVFFLFYYISNHVAPIMDISSGMLKYGNELMDGLHSKIATCTDNDLLLPDAGQHRVKDGSIIAIGKAGWFGKRAADTIHCNIRSPLIATAFSIWNTADATVKLGSTMIMLVAGGGLSAIMIYMLLRTLSCFQHCLNTAMLMTHALVSLYSGDFSYEQYSLWAVEAMKQSRDTRNMLENTGNDMRDMARGLARGRLSTPALQPPQPAPAPDPAPSPAPSPVPALADRSRSSENDPIPEGKVKGKKRKKSQRTLKRKKSKGKKSKNKGSKTMRR